MQSHGKKSDLKRTLSFTPVACEQGLVPAAEVLLGYVSARCHTLTSQVRSLLFPELSRFENL